MNMTDLNNTVLELTVDELDTVSGGKISDMWSTVSAFWSIMNAHIGDYSAEIQSINAGI
jgi:hypothetical protein